MDQSTVNKHRSYWETMRNNLHLVNKAEIDESTINIIRAELSDILDSGILTYPQTLSQLGIEPGMSLIEKKEELGIKKITRQKTFEEKKFLEDCAVKAHVCRQSNWAWRIAEEAEQKQKDGWHPFFVTLTVDPKKTDPEKLWREGREFRKYIRRLVNIVCDELGHPPAHKRVIRNKKIIWDYRRESDYVTYAGVIEHGKSRAHHHGHFIIWLRRIPASWTSCPNAGIRNPANRTKNICLPMCTYWNWSGHCPETGKPLSPALYFRTVGDIWETKYNFVLPLKDGKPMKVSTTRVAGVYITKYLSKEYKEWHHRMRATRNLGVVRLKKIIKQMLPTVVEALTWRAESSSLNNSLMMTHTVPLGLLRSEAKQINFLNMYKAKRLDLTRLLRSNYGIFSKMLWSVRNGQRPDRMDSSDYFDWVGRLLPAQEGYCKKKLIAAHCAIANYYPVERRMPPPTKLGGNEI